MNNEMVIVNRTLCNKYDDFIIKKQVEEGDLQTVYKFPNGYGASVIDSIISRGLELAVLYFDGDSYSLSHDTPITNDVVNYIASEKELEQLLDRVYALGGGAE